VGVRIARVTPGQLWHALDDDEVVGRAYLRRRPDARAYLAADAWLEDVAAELLAAAIADVPGDLHATADENDAAQLALLGRAGFTELRREDEYLLPVGAVEGTAPAGYAIVSAADVDLERLARLDERLRQDVPGSDGWVNELAEFRAYTVDERHFDPALYLVAVAGGGEYAGLVRVWRGSRVPRLGLVGVLRWHRRRGLARTLLRTVFGTLAERGVELVGAEADATNTASQTLLKSLGARRTGGSVELVRRG
jgi:ribosomal protein S18 acetylase RimI-like enzyme